MLFTEGAKELRRVDRVIAGYRQHVDLEPDELSRLEVVTRARWLILKTWECAMGRKNLVDTTREVAQAHDQAAAVAAQAWSAFAAKRST